MSKIIQSPEPKEIKDLRHKLNLTTAQAGNLLHITSRTFQRWERGNTKMPYAYWELFELKCRVIANKQGQMAHQQVQR